MKKSRKNKIIVISIISLVLLSLIAVMIISQPAKHVTYFYDKNLKMIKIEVKDIHGIWKFLTMFQQTITFSQTTANVGDTVTLQEAETVPSTYIVSANSCVGSLQLFIVPPAGGSQYSVKTFVTSKVHYLGGLSSPLYAGDIISTSATFSPTSAGTWSGKTTYYESDCTTGNSRIGLNNGGYDKISANNVVVTGATVNCNSNYVCSTTTDLTSIKVETCTKEVPNGNACSTNTMYKTTCKEGYEISGTNGQSYAEDTSSKSCEVKPAAIIDCTTNSALCTSGQICNAASKLCESPECNADLKDTCADGVNVTLKYCYQNKWDINNSIEKSVACASHSGQSTNTTVITNTTIVNNSTNLTIVNNTKTSIDCFIILTATDGIKSCSERDIVLNATDAKTCPLNYYSTQAICEANITVPDNSLLYTFIILGVSVIIVIIIILLIRKYKK
jgi:hypothetical protein